MNYGPYNRDSRGRFYSPFVLDSLSRRREEWKEGQTPSRSEQLRSELKHLDSDPEFRKNVIEPSNKQIGADPDLLIPELRWWGKLLVWFDIIKDPRFESETEKLNWIVRKRIREIDAAFNAPGKG
jgi:hypothetical protein